MKNVFKETCFLWGKVLVNLFTDKVFYITKRCKHFLKNIMVKIGVGHWRMTEKSFCVLGKV